MSYVDAWFDRANDMVRVVERNKKGEREFRDIPVKHTFYVKDPKGKHQSIYGDALTRIVCKNTKELRKAQAINSSKELFESDINPIFQCLSENYLNQDGPKMNIAFFDIETDFNQEKGFAPPEDPFNSITAISLHLSWLKRTICLAIKPDTLTKEQAQAICDKFEDTVLFDTEAGMLESFLDLIVFQ